MTLTQRLNPRLHLAAAIGWAVFGVVTLAALVTANFAAALAERQARADAEGQLAELATQVRDAVSMNLETRRSLLQATAAQISASGDHSASAMLRTLAAVRIQFPEMAWLAVADATGHVQVGTPGQGTGGDVSNQTWFREGQVRAFVELQAPVARATSAAVTKPSALVAAAPLAPSQGPVGGVIAAELSWSWVEGLVTRMQDALNKHRQLELMVADREGRLLVGPEGWPGHHLQSERDPTEGGAYVVGSRAQLRLAHDLGLGWTTIVRQPADIALAPARTTRRTVFAVVFMAGLLAAVAAALATKLLTRRLSALAAEAQAVRRGTQRSLAVPAGADEVSSIGATLVEVVDHLQAEKLALHTLNVELDHRVAERTARIERLAEDARHAAVTRERLRIARDLHDTLAHSMMALLTQVRLVRKLRTRMAPDELDAELGRAEAVATTGLAEARAAINQIRGSGVRDSGLGPALQELARRFGERSGLALNLGIDARSEAHADERAETVFRIVEEALRNVERHAQATQVRLQLRCQPVATGTEVQIDVTDDGIGFDPSLPQTGHFGLRGMQEQAALIHAELLLKSHPGQGTSVQLRYAA